jgi:DNA-binding beta-propeller fold protein YncE
MAYDAASNRVWVWESGNFFVTGDGGIEAIDPMTNRIDRLIATEEDLGGSITVVAPYTRARAFAVVADEQFNNSLVAFSPATGARLDRLHRADGFFPDVAVDSQGAVWLADRTLRNPGVRVFDAITGAPLAGLIDVGLPPFDILFLP